MANNIDKRIVEMQFQNEQFERGIDTSVKSLDRLKESLRMDGAERGLDNLQRSADHFSMSGMIGAVEAVGQKFSALEMIAIGALTRIGSRAADVGINMAKSLSIDQISAGFTKYADKTKSMNTIMNATGESVDTVNGYLEKLSWFTDETSYNFTDMVSNIGKFTSAGVNLDDATNAMMGIALEAAISGQGINEASRAMYNFSQSIGMGKVRLSDWMSIENANMATKEFKDNLIDAAVSLGKLKKDSKGTAKTMKGTEVTFQNFRDTLNQDWLTKDVLLKALGKYSEYANEVFNIYKETGKTAGEIMEELGNAEASLGGRAFKAGQVARTFQDAVEATKDAVSSGWMQSFEHIFGNVEESAELWTDVTSALWEVFAAGAEERNEVLKAWHDNGGRADLLEGLYDSFESLWNIITEVREAFAIIFPVDWEEKLSSISTSVKDFGANMKKIFGYEDVVVGQEEKIITTTVPKVTEAFKQLNFGERGKEVETLQKRLESLGYSVGKAGADGIFGSDTQAALKKYQEEAGLAITGVYDKATQMSILTAMFGTKEVSESEGLVDVIEQKASPALEKIQNIAQGAASALKLVTDALTFVWNVATYVADLLSPLGSAVIDVVELIAKCVTGFVAGTEEMDVFGHALEMVKGYLEPLRPIIDGVANAIRSFFGVGDESVVDFSSMWDKIKTSFNEGIQSLREWLATNPITKSIYDFFTNMFPENKIAVIKYKAKLFFIKIGQFFTNLWSSIGGIFGGGEGEKGPTNVVSQLGAFFKPISDLIATIGTWLSGIDFKALGSTVGSAIMSAFSTVGQFFTNVGKWFTSVWNSAKNLLNEQGRAVILYKVRLFFIKLGKRLKALWDSVKNIFSAENRAIAVEKIRSIFNKISEVAGTVWQFITNIFSSDNRAAAMEKVRSLLSKIGEFFRNVWTSIREWFSGRGQEPNTQVAEKSVESTVSIFEKIGEAFSRIRAILPLLGLAAGVGLVIVGVLKVIKTLTSFFEVLNVKKYGPDALKETQNFGDTMLKAAGAIAIVAAAIIALGFVPGEQLAKGAFTIVGISILLVSIEKAFVKIGKVNPKAAVKAGQTMLSLAGAIGILAAVMWILGKADFGQMLKGAALTAIIIAMLLGTLVLLNKLNAVRLNVKGLIELSVAVGILAGVMWLIGNMANDNGQLWQGLGGVLALLTMLVGAVVIMKRIGSTKIKVSGLIGLSVAIGILAFVTWSLSMMDSSQLKKGLKAVAVLGVLLAAMHVAFSQKLTGKMDYAGLILSVIGLAAVMTVFGEVVKGIKDVDSTKMITFAGSVAGLLTAITVLSLVAGKIGGVGTMASGALGIGVAFAEIVAIVTAVIAGLGALDTLLDGNLVAAIDAGGVVLNAVGRALANFGSGFLDVFIEDMKSFGDAVSSITTAVSAVGSPDEIVEELGGVFLIANRVKDYFSTLEPYEFTGSNLDGYATAAAQLATDMTKFATGITDFVNAVTGFNTDHADIEVDTDLALKMAGKVHEFASGLVDEEGKLNGIDVTTYKKAVDAVTAEISNISSSLTDFRNAASGLSTSTIEEDTTVAIGVLGEVADFISSLQTDYEGLTPKQTALAALVTGYQDKTTSLIEYIGEIGTALGLLRDAISGFSTTSIAADSDTAVDVLEEFTEFLNDVNAKYTALDQKKTLLASWIDGKHDTTTSLITNINSLTGTLTQIKDEITGFSETSIKADATVAVDVVTEFTEFLDGVNAKYTGLEGNVSKLEEWVGTSSTVTQSLVANIGNLGTALGNVKDAIADFSKTSIKADASVAVDVVTEFTNFLNDVNTKYTGLEGNVSKLEEWVGKSSTVTQSLIDNIGSLGSALGDVKAAIAGFSETSIKDDSTVAVDVAGQFADFINDISTDYKNIEKDKAGWIEAITGYETTTETLFGHIEALTDTIKTAKKNVSGISESTIIDDTQTAIDAIQSFADFLIKIPSMEVETEPPEWISNLFLGKSKTDTIFSKLSDLSDGMKTAKTDLTGLSGKGSTFSDDFNAAIDALTSVAKFLQDLNGMDLPKETGVIERIFSGESNPMELVMNVLKNLGDENGRFQDALAGIKDLSTGTFQDDFDAALGALQSMANFLVSMNTFDEFGNAQINDGAIMRYENVSDELVDLGEKIQEFIASTEGLDVSRAEEIAGAIDKIQNSISVLGTDIGGALAKTITENTAPVEAIGTLLDNVVAEIDLTMFDQPGQDLMSGLADGIEAMDYVVSDAVQGNLNGAYDSINPNLLFSVGQNIAVGLANGISNMAYAVRNATIAMMNGVVSAATFTVQVRSPSRVFANIGKYIDLGLEEGIREYGYAVDAAVDDTMQGTVDRTGTIIAQIEDALSSDMDMSPMIRPVLDMSDVTDGTSAFYDTLNPTIRANVVGRAGSTSSDIAGRIAANTSTTATVDDKAFAGSRMQEAIINAVGGSMAEIKDSLSHLQLVTETGTLIATIGPGIDNYLGRQQIFAERRL